MEFASKDIRVKTIPEALFRYKDSQKPAVICGERIISYMELWILGNTISRHLIRRGIRKGDRIVLDMERSELAVCMLVGIAMMGGIAVFIHREWPRKQKEYVIEDCAPALIVNNDTAKNLMTCTVDEIEAGNGQAAQTILPPLTGKDPFLIVYTSGSTGRPKGAVLAHLTATNSSTVFQTNRLICADMENCDVRLMDMDFSYVASTVLIARALFNGAALVVATDRDIATPGALAALIRQYKRISVSWTPTRIKLLLSDPEMVRAVDHIKVLAIIGEKVPEDLFGLLDQHMPHTLKFCTYGMSEMMQLENRPYTDKTRTLVESPLPNIGLHVLDSNGSPVPEGVMGEICISGIPAMFGRYWNNPELTDNRYMLHPKYGRIFRTGDLAMQEGNGRLRLMGRNDQMAKLRGIRIDLEAIEKVISVDPEIKDVIAMVLGEGDAQVLTAFFTHKLGVHTPQPMVFESRLRKRLAEELPYYMIPAYLIPLDKIPMNLNGKADRLTLSRMMPERVAYRAAGTAFEKLLCDLYTEILHLPETAGVDDSFFRLGGDSLSGMVLADRLAGMGIRMEIKWLFAAPTPSLLAGLLTQNAESGMDTQDLPPLPEWTDAVRMAASTAFAPNRIECVYPVTGNAEKILRQRDPYMLVDFWEIDFDVSTVDTFKTRLEEMTRCHQALRSVFLFPEGERPVQAVLRDAPPTFFYTDRSFESVEGSVLSDRQRRYLSRLVNFDLSHADLTHGPLFKVGLIRTHADKAVVYRLFSHVLLDGQSAAVLLDELLCGNGVQSDRKMMDRHYRRLLFEDKTTSKEYWQALGLKEHSVSALPSSKGTERSVLRTFLIDGEYLFKKTAHYCHTNGITIASALHYCLGRALCGLLGQKTVTFLSITTGRHREEMRLPGMFIHTFPFVFKSGDSVLDCQEQLILSDNHAWIWCFQDEASIVGELGTRYIVLDVINVQMSLTDDSASAMPLTEVLEENALGSLLTSMYRKGRNASCVFIEAIPAFSRLYFGRYDTSEVDGEFVRRLSKQLTAELKELIG